MQPTAKSSAILKTLAAAMLLAFTAGGLWLLFVAFEIGDVYPPFSSHRAELDGTQVLYEALERLPELRVVRHYGPADAVRASGDMTILVVGLPATESDIGSEEELRDFIRLADQGARLIITLQTAAAFLPGSQEGKGQKRIPPREGQEEKPPRPAGERLLQVRFKTEANPVLSSVQGRTVKKAYVELTDAAEPLPERLPWRASSYLEPRDQSWRTVYAWAGRPTFLRRAQGKGEIVIVAGSFLLTNRAMWEARYPGLLTWLVGDRRRVVFYERHLGVAENPGIAWLIRRYDLEGIVAALLIIAALFVWRNSVPLVSIPPPESEAGNEPMTIRGSSLAALVSRSLPGARVLHACVDEWKKTERPNREVSDRIENLVCQKGDVVAIYRQIAQTLKDRS